jgi:hypothetical protein
MTADSQPGAKPRKALPPPNPVTRRRHRVQVRRWIVAPFLAAVVVLGATAGLVITRQLGSVASWAQVALILLELPALALGGVALVLATAAGIAVTQALRLLPPYTSAAQQAVAKVEKQIKAGADISVKPLITIRSYLALVESLFGRSNGKGASGW